MSSLKGVRVIRDIEEAMEAKAVDMNSKGVPSVVATKTARVKLTRPPPQMRTKRTIRPLSPTRAATRAAITGPIKDAAEGPVTASEETPMGAVKWQ